MIGFAGYYLLQGTFSLGELVMFRCIGGDYLAPSAPSPV